MFECEGCFLPLYWLLSGNGVIAGEVGRGVVIRNVGIVRVRNSRTPWTITLDLFFFLSTPYIHEGIAEKKKNYITSFIVFILRVVPRFINPLYVHNS